MSNQVKDEKVSYRRNGGFEIVHLKNCLRIFASHSHASVYIIGVVFAGDILLTRATEERICTGQYYIIPPYQTHSLSLHGNYELLSICIDAPRLATFSRKHLTKVLSEVLPSYPLAAELAQNLYVLESPRIKRAEIAEHAHVIHEYPEREYPIADLARTALTNRAAYIRAFREEVGTTPHKFQLQSKVRHAQRALERNQDISTLAMELGFYDQSHLNKCFKSFVGMTPLAYQESAIEMSSTRPV